jgi:hypothetical protein
MTLGNETDREMSRILESNFPELTFLVRQLLVAGEEPETILEFCQKVTEAGGNSQIITLVSAFLRVEMGGADE